MFYTYVLKTLEDNHRYIGHCENLFSRLKDHNSGKVKSIKSFRPWKRVYYDQFNTREEAITRERYLKFDFDRK